MALGFALTRSRLQALVECGRRFWLHSIRRVPWPAATEASGAQEAFVRGQEFHRLMERQFLGLPVDPVAPDLREWWGAWQAHPLTLPAGWTRPEVTLSIPVAGERLVARYDLLAIPADPDGTLVIVDWKTGARPRARAALNEDMQSRLYPYVLVEGAAAVTGRALRPEGVELVYWQAAAPADPVRFGYTAAEHESNGHEIEALIDRAHGLNAEAMPPVIEDLSVCARCPYRTFCNQPVGPAPPESDDLEPDLRDTSDAGDEEMNGALR